MASISLFLFLSLLGSADPERIATASQPCWERDALPILKRSCLGCHGPGSAMGNLSTLDSATSHARLMRQNLASGKMPMRGDLPDRDRGALIAWASQGATRCP